MLEALRDALCRELGLDTRRASLRRLGGSSFDATYRLAAGPHRFFVKHADRPQAGRLRAEADGLARLDASGRVRVPAVAGLIDHDTTTCLVLEWLDLRRLSTAAAATLGRALAEHHRSTTADRHGLDRDNWIGGTPQVNTPTEDWTTFLFRHRIGALIDRLARADRSWHPDRTERLADRWRRDFDDYHPVPSLLHGDLWGGNAGMRADGTPVVYDPAVHYGDRECDLAMAALFGGFGAAFFEAYDGTWPLEPGWELRRRYYQLYHVLNHALLFGGGYVDDAKRRIASLTD